MDRASLARLRRQPGYAAFLLGATLARTANEMFSVGVVLLVLARTDDPMLAGLTLAGLSVPSFASGPLLGAWLDLTGRRKELIILNQGLMAVTVTAIVLAAGRAPDWTLPAIALVAGLTYPLSFGGFTSLLPSLVPGELLTGANAIETTSFNLAVVAGPALVALIAGAAGPATALWVEVGLTGLALVLLLRLPPAVAGEAGRSLWQVTLAGLTQVVRVAPLRGVTVAGALSLGAIGLLTVAFPLWAEGDLGASRGDGAWLWAAFAVGSTVGALGLLRIQERWAPERIVFAGVALLGVAMLSWPLAGSLSVAAALVGLAAVADGPALAATFAVRQRYVPRALAGQVFTSAASLKVGSFALGAAAAGPSVAAVGASGTLLLCAAVQLVAAALGFVTMRVRGPARRAAVPASS